MSRALQSTKIGFAFGRRSRLFGLACALALPFAGCFAEPKPAKPTGASTSGTGASSSTSTSSGGHRAQGGKSAGGQKTTDGSVPPPYGGFPDDGGAEGVAVGDPGGEVGATSYNCRSAVAQPLPARQAVTSNDAPPPVQQGPQVLTLYKKDLFNSFQQNCAANSSCHIGSGDPNAQPPNAFKVTLDTFDQRPTLGDEALMRVTSSDPATWMPPSPLGGDGSARKAGDPLFDLATRLKLWEDNDFKEPITVELTTTDTQPVTNDHPYLLSPTLGQQLTNIGSCIPQDVAALDVVADTSAEMQQKDTFFAGLATSDDLPDTIFETDLVTLDSPELAKRNVFSYAPTYPLYSDNSAKMRYVRVPLGESIHYDATLHDFTIPDNTRFYKTFLKPITDKSGNVGYRKMETRLIVVRQDTQNSDGSYTTHALRASYAWDADEQMAHRVTDPFRDGTAARDRLCPYVVDESVTRDPDKNPISDQISADTCTYMTADQMNDPTSGSIRHYAIPSTQRCDQCHMGSSSHSFVLGFTPWQIDRRKFGEGGTYEEPNSDELTQLQRFIDYGVVTGQTPGEVKLEESQLIADPPRTPRNDYELTAQGYMLGNCAFCHNPHGYPVVTNPILKEFELFPSETGGIFQFPLTQFSPRAKAGLSQSVRIPYISSDFTDVDLSHVNDGGSNYAPRGAPFVLAPQGADFSVYPVLDATNPDSAVDPDYDRLSGQFSFLAPWRSLIWRNTYTPFTYNEDGTLYIHMPRNVAGFDCRVADIMARWMLSIPTTPIANLEQPMAEVSNTDPTQAYAYGQAVFAATTRVAAYDRGVSGEWCPVDDDIVDPKVIDSPVDPNTGAHTQLAPIDEGFPPGPRVNPAYDFTVALGDQGDGVPDHAHWIPTDTTEAPGKWIPRRQNWQDFLVKRDVDVSADLSSVIDDLQHVMLSPELENFALEELPMGTWHPDCQMTPEAEALPTVGALLADPSTANGPLTRWLAGGVFDGDAAPSKTAHVHEQSRGEAVFHAICQNCHGQNIDSKSALAATIQELTGGSTRVANFTAGLFGPTTAPGAYAQAEFTIGDGLPSEDWQSRYLLFMGLGGTGANIPTSVLNLVATSPFYGEAVTVPGANSPNMLGSAQQLCFYVLANTRDLSPTGPQLTTFERDFVSGVGHYELWESLCTYANAPVVHLFNPGSPPTASAGSVYRAQDDSGAWIYPENALVGNNRGGVETGIQSTNLWPWCVKRPANTQEATYIQDWETSAGLGDSQVPYCPDAILATVLQDPVYNLALDTSTRTADTTVPLGNSDFTSRWLRHGAMNAGLSAFYFMRGYTEHSVTPSQPYDFCRQ